MRVFLGTVVVGLLLAGCSNFPKYQTPFNVRNPQLAGKAENNGTHLAETAGRFVTAYDAAKAEPEDMDKVKAYLDSGITYSHLLCTDYFSRLTFTKAHRDFAKKETNLTGGLASALLGLAKASSGSVAATGAIFSFSEASFDSYDESFLVSPNISLLERLVRETQEQEEVQIYKKVNSTDGVWPNQLTSLNQAERLLSNYVYHCTVNGIRNLLDTSLEEKARKLKSGNEDETKATGTEEPTKKEE